ncbi:MAG: ABC transporter permease subunit [Clostridiales bacterium]
MHIIKRELRAHLKSLMIWSGVMIVLIFLMMSEFAAYYNNPEMADILESMPESMLKAFSMENANLTTVSGYVSLVSFYFYLILGVFSVLLGSSIISKEERDKTSEFFLTLPISREKVIFSKLVAAIINCMILLIVTGGTVIAAVLKYEPNKEFYKFFGLMLIAIFIIQMIFLSIGMFLSSILKRYKSSGKVSASILFGLYIFSIISALNEKLDFLKYVSPFKYFEANKLLNTSEFELKYLLLSFGIITICIIGTFMIYPKRDLRL